MILKFKVLFICIFTVLLFGGFNSASAANLAMNKTQFYYYRNGSNGIKSSSAFKEYTVDGKIAYCIEPGVHEGTDNYIEGSLGNINLSNEVKDRILKIAYYGYGYLDHNSIEYRAATQGLIWQVILNGDRVLFSTELWAKGTLLNVENQMNEIENLVNKHDIMPSFSGNVYDALVGEKIYLLDENNILDNYDFISDDAIITVEGNMLSIEPLNDGEIKIDIEQKKYYRDEYKIFYGDEIQNMLVAGNILFNKSSIIINSDYGKINLIKEDSENKSENGMATLEGAVYELYDALGNFVSELITDENGIANTKNLKYGEYYLQEKVPSIGYLLDEEKHYFKLTNKNILDIHVKEDVIKNRIILNKNYGSNNYLIKSESEANAVFNILNSNSEYYDQIITNEEGIAEITLPFGIWYIKQVTGKKGYKFAQDFMVYVNEKSGKMQIFNLFNEINNVTLKIVKIDSNTGLAITNNTATFKIKDTSTGKYISYYDENHYIDEFSTDNEGKLILPFKINIGTYELYEITAPINYDLLKEPYTFTINESDIDLDENYYELKIANNPIPKSRIIAIPNTFKSSYLTQKALFFLMVYLLLCVSKKRKNGKSSK